MQISFIEAAKLAKLASEAAERGFRYASVISKTQLGLGRDPMEPSHALDLRREEIIQLAKVPEADLPSPLLTPLRKSPRRSGRYWVEVHGKSHDCVSLKEALATALRLLEADKSGTLEALSRIKPRSKRIVARTARDLFEDPNLVEKCAEALMPGWWFGTNNSKAETLTWLKRATALANLTWGKDIKTSFG